MSCLKLLFTISFVVATFFPSTSFSQDCKSLFSRYDVPAQDIETKKLVIVKRSDYALYMTFFNNNGQSAIKIYNSASYSLIKGDKITFYSTGAGVRTFTFQEDNGFGQAISNKSIDDVKWLAQNKINRMVVNRVGRDMRKFTIAFDKSTSINRYATCFYNAMSSKQLVLSDVGNPDKEGPGQGTGNNKAAIAKDLAAARAKASEIKKQYALEVKEAKEKSEALKKQIAKDLGEYQTAATKKQTETQNKLKQLEEQIALHEKKLTFLQNDLEVKQAIYDKQIAKIDSNLRVRKSAAKDELNQIQNKKQEAIGQSQKEVEATRTKLSEVKKELAQEAALARKAYADSVLAYRSKKDAEVSALEEKADEAKKRIMEEVSKSMKASLDQLKKSKEADKEQLKKSKEEVLKIRQDLAEEAYSARKDTAQKIAEMKGTASDELQKIQKELSVQKQDILQKDRKRAELEKAIGSEEIAIARAKADSTKKAIYTSVNEAREEANKIKLDLATDVNQARKDSAQAIAKIRKEAAAEILTYKEEIVQKKKEMNTELIAEREKTNQLVTVLKEEATAEIEKSKEEAIRIKKELAQEVLQAKKDTAQKIKEIKNQAAEEIKKTQNKTIEDKKNLASKSYDLRKSYADTMAKIHSIYKPRINKEIGTARDSLAVIKKLLAEAKEELSKTRAEVNRANPKVVQLPTLHYSAQWQYERADLIAKKKELEIEPLINNEKTLLFKSKYHGYPCTENYQFKNNKLSEVDIMLEQKAASIIDDYYAVVAILRNQFGEPIEREEKWLKKKHKDKRDLWDKAVANGEVIFECVYEIGNTRIKHRLYGKDGEAVHSITSQNLNAE